MSMQSSTTARVNRLVGHVATQPTQATTTETAVECKHPMLIGGNLVFAEGNETVPVINPTTGKEFDSVPEASQNDLNQAILAAKQAFPAWRDLPWEEKQKCFLKFADAVEAKKEEFATALTNEQGKPLASAMGEVSSVGASWHS